MSTLDKGISTLTGIERFGKVCAKASSFTEDGSSWTSLRDWRTGVWARWRGDPGVGCSTGKGARGAAGRGALAGMARGASDGTDRGRLRTAVGGGAEEGGTGGHL